MKHISELETRLNHYFNWNKARMNCFVKILLALITIGTVNLSKIAVAFESKAQIESRYKRLQRFFKMFNLDMNSIAIFIFRLFFKEGEKLYLTIDRTNWYVGKSKINILTLAIAYEGAAIPLFWILLDKAGNATGKEHSEIVKRFIKIFGKDCIGAVLADREFANQYFFEWLCKEEIPFCIRVKEGAKVQMFGEKKFTVKKIFNRLNVKCQNTYIQPIWIHGQKLYVSAGRSERGELLATVTNDETIYKNGTAVAIYLRRWEIENLFQNLKGRGFNFEETHLREYEKISKLMALLAIGFSWAHKVGEWRALKKPIYFKKFKNGLRRPQYSYFRYGLDLMRDVFLKIRQKLKEFLQWIDQLFTFPDHAIPSSPGVLS